MLLCFTYLTYEDTAEGAHNGWVPFVFVKIIKRYMTLEEPYDYEVYNEMGISESKFYRIREKAFYKLAFALRIEVYKEEAPV